MEDQRTYYAPGAYNIYCQRCQAKRKSFEVKKEWTGLMVCADKCWEPKHVSLTPIVRFDNMNVPFANSHKDPSATSQPHPPYDPTGGQGPSGINGNTEPTE